LICFAIFELLNKNIPKYEEYLTNINTNFEKIISSQNNLEIRESDHFKKILETIISEKTDEKILKLLKEDIIKQQIFDQSYTDVLSKLE